MCRAIPFERRRLYGDFESGCSTRGNRCLSEIRRELWYRPAFTCLEEAFCPERDFDLIMFEVAGLSAYQYLDSPWLQSYARGSDTVTRLLRPLSHYLIFGADNNVDVITSAVPTVEVIQEKTTLLFEYEV
jgi:hypothetical protein